MKSCRDVVARNVREWDKIERPVLEAAMIYSHYGHRYYNPRQRCRDHGSWLSERLFEIEIEIHIQVLP